MENERDHPAQDMRNMGEDAANSGPEPDDQPPRGRREPLFNVPFAIVLVVAVTLGIEAGGKVVFDDPTVQALYYYGGFIPARYDGSLSGETVSALISPVTYAFSMAVGEHVIFNDIWLARFRNAVVLRIGGLRFAASGCYVRCRRLCLLAGQYRVRWRFWSGPRVRSRD